MTPPTHGEQGDPPGVDLGRLADWFAGAVPTAGRLRSTRLIAGGKSNLTYEITDGEQSWVLRRPPLGHVLATAHDMGREYRVIAALAGTGVPVPATYALCQDNSVIGAPFYVMELVAGTPFRHAADLALVGADRARTISQRLVDTLAELHLIDPHAVGLADFGRAEGFAQRQIRRWAAQLENSHSRDLPAAAELSRRLAANVPTAAAAGIVHGDYRLDNVLFDRQDRPRAIIDWEMATLGDPITDVALLVVYHRLATLPGGDAVTDVAATPGFLSEDEVLARYRAASGRDLPRFGFYLGLASYKLAAIAEGIHYRYVHGQTVGDGFDHHIGLITEPLLEAGLASLKECR